MMRRLMGSTLLLTTLACSQPLEQPPETLEQYRDSLVEIVLENPNTTKRNLNYPESCSAFYVLDCDLSSSEALTSLSEDLVSGSSTYSVNSVTLRYIDLLDEGCVNNGLGAGDYVEMRFVCSGYCPDIREVDFDFLSIDDEIVLRSTGRRPSPSYTRNEDGRWRSIESTEYLRVEDSYMPGWFELAQETCKDDSSWLSSWFSLAE